MDRTSEFSISGVCGYSAVSAMVMALSLLCTAIPAGTNC